MQQHHNPDEQIVENTVDARQGDRRQMNTRVLLMSTIGAAVALAILVFVFAS